MDKRKFPCLLCVSLLLLAIVMDGCCTYVHSEPALVSLMPQNTTIETSITPQFSTSIEGKMSISKLSGWVVYTSSSRNAQELFRKNLDTGDITQLTNSDGSGDAEWSPDGTQIIFTSSTKGRSDDVFIIDRDGSNPKPLIATEANEKDASWSPSSNKIVFTSDQSGGSQIYVLDIKTKKTIKLTNAFTYAAHPAWSSDGNRIAFQSADGGKAGRSQIFIMNSDGSNVVQMTNYDVYTFDGEPVWCPDDSCLVFSRDVGNGAKLMLLNLASKVVIPLFADTFGETTMQTRLSRSPSRGYLTFVVDREYFAFDMENKELYPFGMVDSLSLSLYP